MEKSIFKKFICLYEEIKELAYGERFGANYRDYPPNINRFEPLVYMFYDIASDQTLPLDIMREVLYGKEFLHTSILQLRSSIYTNTFEKMKHIYSEIEHIMTNLHKTESQ